MKNEKKKEICRSIAVSMKNGLFARAISHKNLPFRNYPRDRPLNIRGAVIFHSLNWPNRHTHKLHTKHPIYEACRRASLLASASRSFIHSFTFTYALLTAEHFLRSWNESLKPRLDAHTYVDNISRNSRYNQNEWFADETVP